MLSLSSLVPILLDKAESEIVLIKKGAEDVVFGLSTSISALNQSAAFDRDDAAIVLEACRVALAKKKEDPNATGASQPAPVLAHQIRRGNQTLWGP